MAGDVATKGRKRKRRCQPELSDRSIAACREFTIGKYFACDDDPGDLPAYASAHRAGHLRPLFGGADDRCRGLEPRARTALDVDIARARHENGARGNYVIDNIFATRSERAAERKFDARVACPRGGGGGGLDEAAFNSSLEDTCRAARLRRVSCGNMWGILKARCEDALLVEADLTRAVSIRKAVSFLEEIPVPIDVLHTDSTEEVTAIINLKATDDARATARDFGATHGLTPDECVRLTDLLVRIQPYPSWLEDRDWTREAWLCA